MRRSEASATSAWWFCIRDAALPLLRCHRKASGRPLTLRALLELFAIRLALTEGRIRGTELQAIEARFEQMRRSVEGTTHTPDTSSDMGLSTGSSVSLRARNSPGPAARTASPHAAVHLLHKVLRFRRGRRGRGAYPDPDGRPRLCTRTRRGRHARSHRERRGEIARQHAPGQRGCRIGAIRAAFLDPGGRSR